MKSQEVNFAAVKRGVAMAAVLRHYQVDDLQGGRRGRYRGRCPIHRGEGRDAFHVDVKRKIFHCFSCGAGGDVLDLVALLNQCTLREAALQLRDWFPGAAMRGEQSTRQRVTKGNICVNPPLKFTLRGVDGGHVYLAAREIQESTAVRFGVGFYRGPGLMSGRIVIPIHDEGGADGNGVVRASGTIAARPVSTCGADTGWRCGWPAREGSSGSPSERSV